MMRGESLQSSMSRYLVDRIRGLPNVEVLPETTVCKLEGAHGALEAIHWGRGPAGETTTTIRHLFLVHRSRSEHLRGSSASDVALDEKGFIRTGSDVALGRRPLETSRDGIFAIGDVRAGSTKRCAAAVGEGAQVISTIHAHLADRGDPLAKAERGRSDGRPMRPHGELSSLRFGSWVSRSRPRGTRRRLFLRDMVSAMR